MPNGMPRKPAPIVDQFNTLLNRRRQGHLEKDAIARLYELVLSELTVNSRVIIADLTVVAGEQRQHGEGIAEAICNRILKVPVEQKLPSLYLLDSIAKNIGGDYVRYFSSRLPRVFYEAYRQLQPSMHPAMHRLFGTWSTVFPPHVLCKIEARLQFSPQVNNKLSSGLKAAESPQITNGRHVSPRYMGQIAQTTLDNNIPHAKGISSTAKIYGQNSVIGYDKFDSDHPEAISSHVGSQRVNFHGSAGRPLYDFGSNKPNPPPGAKHTRPLLSSSGHGSNKRSSSEAEEFAADSSSDYFVDRAPPSPATDYGFSGAIEKDERISELKRKPFPEVKRGRLGIYTTSGFNNGDEWQRTRALINEYGTDPAQKLLNESPQVEDSDIDGIESKVAPLSWQNTEEEEFNWNKMSPTLPVHARTNTFLASPVPPSSLFGPRPGLDAVNGTSSRSDIKMPNQSQYRMEDNSTIVAGDAVSSLDSDHGAIGKISGLHIEENQTMGLPDKEEAPKCLPIFNSSKTLSSKGGDFDAHISTSNGSSATTSRMVSTINSSAAGAQLATAPSSMEEWPPAGVQKSYPPPMNPIPPLQRQTKFDSVNLGNTLLNQGQNNSMYMPGGQQFNTYHNKELALQFPNQQPVLNQHNRGQITPLPQFLPSQAPQYQPFPPVTTPHPPHAAAQPFNRSYTLQQSTGLPSLATITQVPLPSQIRNLRPLPPGLPPTSSHSLVSQMTVASNQLQGNSFSGLIGSLMAQGLISLTEQSPVQDSVGLEFNADLLKERHEPAISALYSDLPRQCRTCGLRFKCQEDHSSHMDWHVTKNRMSKTRKQKPPRKWFVSASVWLSGAEALGTDVVPGFLTPETIVEKKDDEELAVPADEDQKACALCGEAFEEFYSDETEEWMYKGAIYINAPSGLTEDMDRSKLGPIVHAKCISSSDVVTPGNLGQD